MLWFIEVGARKLAKDYKLAMEEFLFASSFLMKSNTLIQAFVNLVEKMIKLKTEVGQGQIQKKEASTVRELMV